MDGEDGEQHARTHAELGRHVRRSADERVGLRDERETHGEHDEPDGEGARPVVQRLRQPLRWAASSGIELPAMKPATQANACSANGSLRRMTKPRSPASAGRAIPGTMIGVKSGVESRAT